jgi:TadE-like protein
MLYARGEERGRMCHLPGTRCRRFCVRLFTKWKEEAGAELFEAALVLPLLLMLLLGIVSFGRAYNVYQTITRAAREGAKAAVLTPCALASTGGCPGSNSYYTFTDIWTQFIDPVLQSANLIPSGVTGVPTNVTNPSITYVYLDPNGTPAHICGVRVSFQYPYTLSLPFTGVSLSTINFRSIVQMRLENQPGTCPVGTSY